MLFLVASREGEGGRRLMNEGGGESDVAGLGKEHLAEGTRDLRCIHLLTIECCTVYPQK